jgi:hypothetical protein
MPIESRVRHADLLQAEARSRYTPEPRLKQRLSRTRSNSRESILWIGPCCSEYGNLSRSVYMAHLRDFCVLLSLVVLIYALHVSAYIEWSF